MPCLLCVNFILVGRYTSRITYKVPEASFDRINQGDQVFFYVGQDAPNVFRELEHIELVSGITATNGVDDPTHTILKAALSSDSQSCTKCSGNILDAELCVSYLASVRDEKLEVSALEGLF